MNDWQDFDLNLLVAFDALMREGSVTRAAARIGIGQPAMSHALARLREAFGEPLFVRGGGAMQPTARAIELARPVTMLLEALQRDVLSERRFDPATVKRAFRLDLPDFLASGLLPALTAMLEAEAPHVRLVTRSSDHQSALAFLAGGEVDIVIGVAAELPPGIASVILFHEQQVCLFDQAACGVDAPISLDDYAALPHVLVSLGGATEGWVDQSLASLGHARFVRVVTAQFMTVPFLLRGRRLAAAVPARLAASCAAALSLTSSPLPLPAPGFDVKMLWHERFERDHGQVWLRARVRQILAA